MSAASTSSPSASTTSTPLSSAPPSPELAKLNLDAVSPEDKEEAARLKASANKAFVGAYTSARYSFVLWSAEESEDY